MLYANSFRSVEQFRDSTGLRPFSLSSDGSHGALGAKASEEFLIASRLRRRDVEFELSVASYFSESAEAMTRLVGLEAKRGLKIVCLPRAPRLQMTLGEAVARRRSARNYTGDALSLPYVAAICRAACGVTGALAGHNGRKSVSVRATASGGGLYPIDLHVVALRVDGLERGVYVYDPRRDAMWQTGESQVADGVVASLAAPDGAIRTSQAAALCLLVARPKRVTRKYGERGLRHVFLEAGAMAHQVALTCAALGIGSVDSSSFYDDEVHAALAIDGENEVMVHLIVLGIQA